MSAPSDHVAEKVAPETVKDLSPDKENGSQIELSREEHGHLTIGDVFRGTAVRELTPFERKAALINA